MKNDIVAKNYEAMLKIAIVQADGYGVVLENNDGISLNAYAFGDGFFEVNPKNAKSKDLILGFDKYVERGIELVKIPYSEFVKVIIDNDLIVIE